MTTCEDNTIQENLLSKDIPTKPENIIQTTDLTKRYGDKLAVNHLNLSIKKGEIFGLLGPNGAGKTTTTLMLLGLTEPSAGSATIDGMDCIRDSIRVKRIVGYLPDNVGFYSQMTGRENLRFTGELNNLPEDVITQRIEKLLDRVGMTYAGDQKTGTYSRGMRQRLGIADVLMKDPQIIIMDEPTLGIDPEGMHELMTLIRELAEKDGRTLLISSHQLYQIQRICDRVGIFVNGNLIACGGIEDLGRQISKDGGCTLEVGVFPDTDDFEKLIRDHISGITDLVKEGDHYLIHSKQDIRRELVPLLINHQYELQHLRQLESDLDEIYRRYFEKAGQDETINNIQTESKGLKKLLS